MTIWCGLRRLYDFEIDVNDHVISLFAGEHCGNVSTPFLQYKEYVFAWGGAYLNQYRYTWLLTPYLATICNLSQALVKNADKSMKMTKNKSEATEIYHIDNSASNGVRIIKELKDPNNTHKYNAKACIKELNKRITRDGIHLKYRGNDAVINNYHFRNFTAYFGIKENEKMCFVYQISSQPQYSYSHQAIDFIYDQIKTSPEKILDDLHEKMAIKKSTPGAKEF